jgi:hypothetical protein
LWIIYSILFFCNIAGVRKCLFCDNSADSQEHLFSVWILQSLKSKLEFRQRRPGIPTRDFSSPPTVGHVCEKCNNGWMSRVEDRVKGVLGPLMHDISIPLSSKQQEAISLWAVKTAMVEEGMGIKPRKHFYQRQECDNFHRSSTIPGMTRIWIGRFSGSELYANGTDIGLRVKGSSELLHGCITTIIVGHVILQVFSVHIPTENHKIQLRTIACARGPWTSLTSCIWPTSARVSWPPPLSFTLTGPLSFNSLTYRWLPNSAIA